eukprot:GHVL01036821.1.p1 GENE.GHVL01036821.1~~GHVL01036821.1.p1  ORF type:complete len:312 (-),score=26.38 GHVL01036821.1:562-1497(-)
MRFAFCIAVLNFFKAMLGGSAVIFAVIIMNRFKRLDGSSIERDLGVMYSGICLGIACTSGLGAFAAFMSSMTACLSVKSLARAVGTCLDGFCSFIVWVAFALSLFIVISWTWVLKHECIDEPQITLRTSNGCLYVPPDCYDVIIERMKTPIAHEWQDVKALAALDPTKCGHQGSKVAYQGERLMTDEPERYFEMKNREAPCVHKDRPCLIKRNSWSRKSLKDSLKQYKRSPPSRTNEETIIAQEYYVWSDIFFKMRKKLRWFEIVEMVIISCTVFIGLMVSAVSWAAECYGPKKAEDDLEMENLINPLSHY